MSVAIVRRRFEEAANKLHIAYSTYDIASDILPEVRSFICEIFNKVIEGSNSILDLLILIINSGIMSSVSELATVCVVFAILPVTVASAERCFSKLKIIKIYLRSSISQDRLDGLSLLAIEHEVAKELDTNDLNARKICK
jgi:hypothetical protein